MENKDLFQKVKDLNLPQGKYALFGSAPMGVRGWKECKDIDVIVTPDIYDEYKLKGWEVGTSARGSEYLSRGDIEVFRDWLPGIWNIQQLIATAEMIDGLPCVRLEDIITWKRLCGREKDLRDIAVIESHIAPFNTYHNHRVEPYFSFVKNGQKTIEGRLNKEWYSSLKPGDHIIVHRQDDERDTIEVVVKAVRAYLSIKEMLESESLKQLLPDVETIEEGLAVYRKFYSEEQEQKYGALAIEVQRYS